MKNALLLVLCLAALPLPASAQVAADDPHAACAAVGYVPRELLEKPVALREGRAPGAGPARLTIR